MRLDSLSPVHVRAAIALYNQLAWPQGGPARPRVARQGELASAASLSEILAHFDREVDPRAAAAPDCARECARYSLRLGNQRYPFMKFVVQEYLVRGEYFFSVDTHDNLEVRPNAPDYAAWEELKAFNRRLKRQIEQAWGAAGLPTYDDLRLLMEGIAARESASVKRSRLLLVDDEEQVALALRSVLVARGYEVELAHDGPGALARLAQDPLPDLLLLDCEMPGFDGQEVLARVRADARLARLPVLVATAAQIDPSQLAEASGFLRKPYELQVLFAFVARLLAARAAGTAPGGPGAAGL